MSGNPRHDADMLLRAATACRNITRQDAGQSTEWFEWVPTWLEGLAERLNEAPAVGSTTEEAQ